MSELNEVKAGKYQLVARSWEHITSEPGKPLDFTRYTRGDVVELNVEDAKRLVAAGAVVPPGSLEKAAAEQAKAVAEEAQRAYDAVLAGLPEDVRAEIAPHTVPATGDPDQGAGDSTQGELDVSKGIEAVMSWVGTDKDRAAQALAGENEKGDDARKTLVAQLEKLIADA